MKFYTLKDAPTRPGDVIFRESWLNKMIAVLTGVALTTIPAVLAVREHSWFLGIMAGLMGLFTLAFVAVLRHALHAQNWLVRCQPGGVLIKIRSYLNEHYPADRPIIFELKPGEVAWVGKTRERRVSPGSERGEVRGESFTWLDIKPVTNDLTELETHLYEERQVKVSSSWGDQPVRVIEGGIIRLNWRSGQHWVTPGPDKALAALARVLRTSVRPEVKQVSDFVQDPGEKRARENKILELAESGDTFAAIKLTRKLYGYSLTEAQKFVDELTGKNAAASATATGEKRQEGSPKDPG